MTGGIHPEARGRTLFVAVWLLMASVLVPFAFAQQAEPRSPEIRSLRVDLRGAQQGHLWRVATWGGISALGGWSLVAFSGRDDTLRRSFGLQTGLWGVINLGIAAAGLLNASAPGADLAAVIEAERNYHDLLLLNTGLNVGYIGVGVALWWAGRKGASMPSMWKGHGSALVIQGLGLLVLDGIALFGSRSRLDTLLGIAGDITALATPFGLVLTAHF